MTADQLDPLAHWFTWKVRRNTAHAYTFRETQRERLFARACLLAKAEGEARIESPDGDVYILRSVPEWEAHP